MTFYRPAWAMTQERPRPRGAGSRPRLPPRLHGLALLHDLAELPWSHGVEDPEACPHDLALGEPQALTQTPCLERFDELVILDLEAELSTDDVGAPWPASTLGAGGDESRTDHKGAREP